MKVFFIKEGDVIPQGFYIKTGALYRPEQYLFDFDYKMGPDGLVEECIPKMGVATADLIIGPQIQWVTFGYNCRWFRTSIRFKESNKDASGKFVFVNFDWKRK